MTTTFVPTATEQPAVTMALLEGQTRATAMFDRSVPFVIPSEQEYFWRFEWQQGERAASADLKAGRRHRFDSDDPTDAARWLDAQNDADSA